MEKHCFVCVVQENDRILNIANKLQKIGIKSKDSLHIASAIDSQCDYFITTDLRILNKKVGGVQVINPIAFVQKMEATDVN